MPIRRRGWVLLAAGLLVACTRHGSPTAAEVCEHLVELRAAHEQLSIPERIFALERCMTRAQEDRDDPYNCGYSSVAHCVEQADTFEQLREACDAGRYVVRPMP